MKILDDGSIEGETFSVKNYKSGYPYPLHKKETYGQYYERVKMLKDKGFHLGDLSWSDWRIYCKGNPNNGDCMQDDLIKLTYG